MTDRRLIGDTLFGSRTRFKEPTAAYQRPMMQKCSFQDLETALFQDFLRIMTVNKSAEEILRACSLRDEVAKTLQSAEDLAQRAYHWSETKVHDHRVLDQLHKVHQDLVEKLVPSKRPRALTRRLDKLVRNPAPKITIVSSCTHFSNCFGLNRFLVLLITRFLELHRKRSDVLRLGKKLKCVKGIKGHTCDGSPITCHGEDHQVDLVDAPQCGSPAGANVSETLTANIVIIRHGIDPSILPPCPTSCCPGNCCHITFSGLVALVHGTGRSGRLLVRMKTCHRWYPPRRKSGTLGNARDLELGSQETCPLNGWGADSTGSVT